MSELRKELLLLETGPLKSKPGTSAWGNIRTQGAKARPTLSSRILCLPFHHKKNTNRSETLRLRTSCDETKALFQSFYSGRTRNNAFTPPNMVRFPFPIQNRERVALLPIETTEVGGVRMCGDEEQRVKRRCADEWASRHPRRRVEDLSGTSQEQSVCGRRK